MGGLAGTAAKLLASLDLDTKPFEAGARRAGVAMDKMGSRAYRIGARIGTGFNTAAKNVGRIGIALGSVAVAAIGKSVQAASNLEQSMGAVDSVFGKSASTIEDWGKRAAEAAGLSQRQVSEMAAVTGAQLQGMGIKVGKAAELSITLQKRAADLAATFGGTTEEAVQAISSLLRGERDPIEKYGVSLKQVDINARVASKGLDTSTVAAKKQSEAIAALELLMEQTAKTEGQFQRETHSLAGEQQKLHANLENTGAIIGKVLLPQLSKLAGRFNEALVAHQPDIERLAGKLPEVFDKLLSVAERLPWAQIADSMKLMGQGAKAALDLFTGMPAWVQTAVLTGWGLNKLTGGALGGIVGELGKGLIKGVLGINAATVIVKAGVVQGAGGVGGAGAAGAAGGAGGALGNLGKIIGVLAIAEIANEFHDEIAGWGKELNKQLFPNGNIFTNTPFEHPEDWQWPLGPKGAPDWARFDPATLVGGAHGVQPKGPSHSPVPGGASNRPLTGSVFKAELAKQSIDWGKLHREQGAQQQKLTSLQQSIRDQRATMASKLDAVRSQIARIPPPTTKVTVNTTTRVTVSANSVVKSMIQSGTWSAATVGAYNKTPVF